MIFLIQQKNQSFLIDSYIKVRTDSSMVPEVRIELTADPYQGSVLPLNYTGA